MNQQKFFEVVLLTLEELRIPHMLTGSVAAMLYGEPRLTNDIDVVIELPMTMARELAEAFSSSEYYCPPFHAIQAEILRGGQFNIIHVESGSKVDFILRKDTDFARTEFQRRIMMPFSDSLEAATATPEDVILSKLVFHQLGEHECLNKIIHFGYSSLLKSQREYIAHYNQERNHQGAGNELLCGPCPTGIGNVIVKERLGGLLKYYHRKVS